MSRVYQIRTIFRQTPNRTLQRYFEERNIDLGIDFKSRKEGSTKSLRMAWLELDKETQNSLNTEFQQINELCCPKGVRSLVAEAHAQDGEKKGAEFAKWISELKNDYERAFLSYLDHYQYWKRAARFFHADRIGSWRKRKKMPKKTVKSDKATVDHFSNKIGSYFHTIEGKGEHCTVDYFRRSERDYFFAYPEDYPQQIAEYDKGKFEHRSHNFAFEIIFIFHKDEGALDIHLKGDKTVVAAMQEIFAAVILEEDELPPNEKDNRAYELDMTMENDFHFDFDRCQGIEDVNVTSLRLSTKKRDGNRLTIEGKDTNAIKQQLKKLSKSVKPTDYYVTRLEMVADVVIDPLEKSKRFRFSVTYPNSCTLKYEDEELLLRKMLKDSKIELKEPEEVSSEATE